MKKARFQKFSALVWCREPGCKEVYVMLDTHAKIWAGQILPCGHPIASALFNRYGSVRNCVEVKEDENV